MIKNIVFDIGNVLVEFGWGPFFSKFQLTREEYDRIAKATVYSPAWNEIDRGVLSEEEVLDLFIANDPEMEERFREIYSDFNGLLRQYDYTKDWIKDLQSRGFKVYCLSNMSFKSVRENADALDFIPMLDGAILSCYYKLIKPQPEIYELLFSKYELNPCECIFFDDLPRNILAAQKMGMQGVVFESKEQAERELASIISQENQKCQP